MRTSSRAWIDWNAPTLEAANRPVNSHPPQESRAASLATRTVPAMFKNFSQRHGQGLGRHAKPPKIGEGSSLLGPWRKPMVLRSGPAGRAQAPRCRIRRPRAACFASSVPPCKSAGSRPLLPHLQTGEQTVCGRRTRRPSQRLAWPRTWQVLVQPIRSGRETTAAVCVLPQNRIVGLGCA
jgi:hypothetical protein